MSRAERQRRYRQRKALGLKVYRVALDDYQVKQLEKAGLLTERAKEDQECMADELGDAIELLLAKAQGRDTRPHFWQGWHGPASMAPPRYKPPKNVTVNTLWKPK
ncbi:hypothetical protein G4Y73_06380 [Wenzhouxiangella sp. XN201]|uniref:hypothetical protein n=1 Tax=Wenzhouxiangella sp. XN201 TaxID=2710755 RepID=UPI0013C69AA4|nr:hypothetical protein [Wenzhouxiangella sp. XN201]NEZ03775.1 hypothetical protein [Wenzhouxiangella sp. XN201]